MSDNERKKYADIITAYPQEDINPAKTLNTVKGIPFDVLPGDFVQFCKHVAQERNVPIDVTLLAALTVAGAATGGLVESYIAGYRNRPSLWTLIIAPSTSGKSQPLADIVKPLQEIDREQISAYNIAMNVWRAENAKSKNPTPRPPKKQMICNASTDAARKEFICDNERGGLYYRDELRAMFKDLYGKHNTSGVEDLLEIADCKGIKIHTKTSDEIKVCEFSFMPILGGIQTAVLRTTFKPEYMDNGLLTRFAPIMFERHNTPKIGGGIDTMQADYWRKTVNKLRSFGNTARVFECSSEGFAVFREEHGKYFAEGYAESPSMDSEANEYKREVYSKTMYAVHRLALIAHCLNVCNESYPYPDINGNEIRWAFNVARYLCQQHMNVYNAIVGNRGKRLTDAELIRMVASRIEEKGQEVNKAEIARLFGIARTNVSSYLNSTKNKG